MLVSNCFLVVTNVITSLSAGFVLGMVLLCLYLRKILVSAVVAFAVNFLAAAFGVDFNWDATWNVFLGAAFGVDFLAAAGAATAVLDFSFIVLFLQRGRCASWLVVAVVLFLLLFFDGAAGVGSIAAVVNFCAATGADVLDLSFVGVIVGVVVSVIVRFVRCSS